MNRVVQFNYAEVKSLFFAPTVFYGSGKVFNIDRNFVVDNKNIFRDYTFDTFINYDKNFGEDHNIKGNLGMSIFQTTGQFGGSQGFDVPDNFSAMPLLIRLLM